jgi:hypothetical protein
VPGVIVNAIAVLVLQGAALVGIATLVRLLACLMIGRLFVVAFRARRLGAGPGQW